MEDAFNDFSELSSGDTSIALRRCFAQVAAERDALRAKLAEADKKLSTMGVEWMAEAQRCVAAEERANAAEEQLEFDRTTCHNFIRSLDQALDGRFWLTEGRGSYAWDDDRYRDEFRDAATALRAVLDPMRKMAQNLASRLPTTEAVMKARVDLNARAETAEKELAYWKTQHDIELTTADELACRLGRLSNAAQAVLDRWDSPKWKDQDPTAKVINELRAALTETPEQSAKLVQAEALREAANLIRQTTPDARSNSNVERGKFEGRMYAIEQLESEAERLEKEAANEHDNK